MNHTAVSIDFRNTRFEGGYWQGLRQPACIFHLRLASNVPWQDILDQFDRLSVTLLPEQRPTELSKAVATHPLLLRLARTALQILDASGMPVMGGASAMPASGQTDTQWLLGLPAVSADIPAPGRALGWTVNLLNTLASGGEIDLGTLRQQLARILKICSRMAPSGTNSPLFLRAAHDEGIPWSHVAKNVYQFGWGSKARWLDSSFTDETSRISAQLARDKAACAKVLRDAGLPVPRHVQVKSESHALEAAVALGYPVVVKAANLDGGRGVYPDLKTPDAVKKAYSIVSRLSAQVLVEQHIEGNDYRLQVYKGEVYWAVHRRPAYVTGNGEMTVDALIEWTNRERKKPIDDPMLEQSRGSIAIDDEALDWLARQGLSLSSVPAKGQHVRLRGVANVSAGGTREGVLHKVHRDNLALVSRAAKVLRLDLAGIDLLIPDISRSWRDVGGAICEVNGQPQMASHLQRKILPRLVPNKGRIPIIMIAGGLPASWDIRERLASALLDSGIRMGWAGPGVVSVGHEQLEILANNSSFGCRALLADTRVDAIVWHARKHPSTFDAFPVDRLDGMLLPRNASNTASPPDNAKSEHRELPAALPLAFDIFADGTKTHAELTPDEFCEKIRQLIRRNINKI